MDLLVLTNKNFLLLFPIFYLYLSVLRLFFGPFSSFPPLFFYSRHNSPNFALKSRCPPVMPIQIEYVIGKTCQKQMYFVSLQAYILGFTPTKMQRKYSKNPLYLRPDSRKNSITFLLSGTQRPISPRFGQYPVKLPFFPTSPLQPSLS